MPAQQKKLTSFSSSLATSKPALKARTRGQKKLHELNKVVRVNGGALNYSKDDVLDAKAALEKRETTATGVLDRLRWLSCINVTKDLLMSTGIAFAVRPLKKSGDIEVARVAANLITKWKAAVAQEVFGQ